jgi:hypothetical protein
MVSLVAHNGMEMEQIEIQRWLRDVQRVASSGRSLIPQDRREAEDVDRNSGHD